MKGKDSDVIRTVGPKVPTYPPSSNTKGWAPVSAEDFAPEADIVQVWHTWGYGLDPAGSGHNQLLTPPQTLHTRTQDSIAIPHHGAGNMER